MENIGPDLEATMDQIFTAPVNFFNTCVAADSWEDYDYDFDFDDDDQDQEHFYQEPEFEDEYQEHYFEEQEQEQIYPESDIEDLDDLDQDDDDEHYRLPNAHREYNQSEIDLHNLVKVKECEKNEINYNLEETPDAPWIDFREDVDTAMISNEEQKKIKNKPNVWSGKGSTSLFSEVIKKRQKIESEKKLVSAAVAREKILIEKRKKNKENLYKSVACKFVWDKRNSRFKPGGCACRNRDGKHRQMFAHTHNELRPPICIYDRLCKNPLCSRLHTVLVLSSCTCGENKSSRHYPIVCSCERRLETKKEFKIRTGLNYTGDPYTKTHCVKIFDPVHKEKEQTIVDMCKFPSVIKEKKQKGYEAWKAKQKTVRQHVVAQYSSCSSVINYRQ